MLEAQGGWIKLKVSEIKGSFRDHGWQLALGPEEPPREGAAGRQARQQRPAYRRSPAQEAGALGRDRGSLEGDPQGEG